MTKFGHHPDPQTDIEIECDRLRGMLVEAHVGLIRALDFRTASPDGLAIKADVRRVLRETGFTGDLGYRQNF